MKKVLIVLLMSLATNAGAQHRHYEHQPRHNYHQHQHRHWNGYNWVVPAIIGGAAVYLATRPGQTVIVDQPIMNNPQYVTIDGIVYERQYAVVNGVAREVLVRIR